jgi:hypothetical protein
MSTVRTSKTPAVRQFSTFWMPEMGLPKPFGPEQPHLHRQSGRLAGQGLDRQVLLSRLINGWWWW